MSLSRSLRKNSLFSTYYAVFEANYRVNRKSNLDILTLNFRDFPEYDALSADYLRSFYGFYLTTTVGLDREV